MDNGATVNLYARIAYSKKQGSDPLSAVSIVSIDQKHVEKTSEMNFTPQRLELYCLKTCLSFKLEYTTLNIFSTSSYAVDCINKWSTKWKDSDWKIGRKSKDNIKLTKEILDIIFMLQNDGKIINVCHIGKNHKSIYNSEAYRLALANLTDQSD